MKPNRIAGLLLLISLLLLAATDIRRVGAQSPSVTPTPTVAATPAPATSPSRTATTVGNPPKVTGIDGHLELDSIIKVEVANFSEWAATHDATKLVPFLNGRAVRGGYPNELHPDRRRLRFDLLIMPENKHRCIDLLGAP